MNENESNAFENAGRGKQARLPGEFFQFLRTNKKFWMIPLILPFLLLGALIILGGTAAAPFIYSLF